MGDREFEDITPEGLINRLLKEKDELIEDLYKRDKTIEELKYTIEKKGLQLQEIQANMDTALEAMRKTELKCKELETRYKAVERQDVFMETSPLILNNLPQNTETEVEYINKTEALNNTLAALKTKIDEKTAENVFLRNEISLNQPDKNRDSIDNEASEAEDISLKLALAAGRDTALLQEEKTAKKLSADKKLLYVKSPIDTESGSQFSGKMIYVAPPKSTDIKKKALRIAILFILGMAGIFLVYKFF